MIALQHIVFSLITNSPTYVRKIRVYNVLVTKMGNLTFIPICFTTRQLVRQKLRKLIWFPILWVCVAQTRFNAKPWDDFQDAIWAIIEPRL